MRLLSYANWKQKLPFDNIVYKEVKRYSLRLNSYERAIMDAEINFYRQRFSLLQAMNHFRILKTKLAKEIFIKAVLKRKENILYLPNCLVSHFKKKIKTEFADHQAFFEILLEQAINTKPINPIIPVVRTIMGEYYRPIIKRVNKYSKMTPIRVVQKTLKPAAYENMARIHIQKLQEDICLSNIYGRSSIRKNVPISVVDDYGYGEWVSKNVSFATNRLFIYSNNNKLTDVGLEHMIYFNVYPGYGYFYNTVVGEGKQNISFDNGATYLINGWAMYAMCHSMNSAYSNSLLIESATIAKHLLNKNLEKGLEDVYIYLLGKYPKAKAIDYMIDYTQYPGKYLSFALGEFATELVMQNDFAHNPKDYLETLSTINCGDFFALYSKKMQKKIAKTNITAKVASKFAPEQN